ncbi:MAG TPA: hypothetical protein VK669_12395 [Candidatus Limnocylindrales bacterium]|nr:hypothetical protein [Candidatus Limnocylindrales bacterium]
MERGNTLWVGTASAVYAYPKLRNGPAGTPKRSILFAPQTGQHGYDTTVAPDGTVYESLGDGVTIYGPWVNGAGDPEEHLALGDKAVILGYGIDTIDSTIVTNTVAYDRCFTATIRTYAYGAGPNPSPQQTLSVPFECDVGNTRGNYMRSDFATDTNDRLYVYHGYTVQVFAPGASGNASPLQTFKVNVPMPTQFTVGADGTVYILATDVMVEHAYVYEWAPDARNSSSPSRTLGPFDLRNRGAGTGTYERSLSAIAVDAKGRLFVAENPTNGPAQVLTFAPGASGNAAPIATLTNPVPAGTPITSLAIGP